MYNQLLNSFITVIDNGSFNKAAEKLFISSTAVIKQINALETHLNMKLVERTHHGIKPTDAGAIIYRTAKEIIAFSEKAISEATAAITAQNKSLSVGTSMLNPCKPFMDVWYKVHSAFPQYKLNIVPFEDNHKGIMNEISALGNKYDFLIAPCDAVDWLNLCEFLPIGTYSHCICVSRTHPLAGKRYIEIADLSGYTVQMVKKGLSENVDKIRTEIEGVPNVTIIDAPSFYDIEVFNDCEQSQNILLSLECWKDIHPALVSIPVKWNYSVPYGILYSKNANKNIVDIIQAISKLKK